MLTSRGHRADAETVERTNIVRLVAKPFSSHEMVKFVAEVFASKGDAASEAA